MKTRRRVDVLLALGLGATYSALLAILIARYWAYFRFGSAGGNGFALTLVVLPVATLVGAVAVSLTLRYSTSRQFGRTRSIALAVAVIVTLLVVGFAAEVVRSHHLPSEREATPQEIMRAIIR